MSRSETLFCDPAAAVATPSHLTPRMARQPANRVKGFVPRPQTPRGMNSFKDRPVAVLGSNLNLEYIDNLKTLTFTGLCAQRVKQYLKGKTAPRRPLAEVVGEFSWHRGDRNSELNTAMGALGRLVCL